MLLQVFFFIFIKPWRNLINKVHSAPAVRLQLCFIDFSLLEKIEARWKNFPHHESAPSDNMLLPACSIISFQCLRHSKVNGLKPLLNGEKTNYNYYFFLVIFYIYELNFICCFGLKMPKLHFISKLNIGYSLLLKQLVTSMTFAWTVAYCLLTGSQIYFIN